MNELLIFDLDNTLLAGDSDRNGEFSYPNNKLLTHHTSMRVNVSIITTMKAV